MTYKRGKHILRFFTYGAKDLGLHEITAQNAHGDTYRINKICTNNFIVAAEGCIIQVDHIISYDMLQLTPKFKSLPTFSPSRQSTNQTT